MLIFNQGFTIILQACWVKLLLEEPGGVQDDDGRIYDKFCDHWLTWQYLFVSTKSQVSWLVSALLSSVSILFENHSNNSENEWKCFVIGPLEKLSVTLRFSSGVDCQQTGDRSLWSGHSLAPLCEADQGGGHGQGQWKDVGVRLCQCSLLLPSAQSSKWRCLARANLVAPPIDAGGEL